MLAIGPNAERAAYSSSPSLLFPPPAVLGHTFFLEEGSETGNTFDSNLAIWTRRAYRMLNSDATPASFYVSNPANTFTNNVAAGSEENGWWFNLNAYPSGSSYTTAYCPQGVMLTKFAYNKAHSK